MASRLLDRKNGIIFGFVILLGFAGNAWISYEVKKLEDVSAVADSPIEHTALIEESREVYGIVKIDPNNDPLAPVVHLASQKAAPRNSVASNPQLPVYEPPSDSVVLVQ